MSSRNNRGSGFTQDEINGLLLKLQALLPDPTSRCTRVPTSKILEEMCSYIKRLRREVDDLSERLSQSLSSMDSDELNADFLRSLLQQ
ncbi:unnamed protein product [Ilex paraguariensis]|uniref:BHLH domain-containing protein n=1 Tax=Ilex paraguariensis TaxID=185542 RepID=A0ABC8SKW8_9AQUA